MSYWESIESTYIYDGTIEGLFTIIFDCYLNKIVPLAIITKESYQPNILDNIVMIETDYEKYDRIFTGIQKNISYDALYNSHNAFLCEEKNKELDILKYIFHSFKDGPKVNTMLSIDYVFHVNTMRRKSLGECHRLKGLLRFIEIGKDLFYASIHPDNNILEPLGQHFINRLPNQNFIIHDKIREKIFLYNTKKYRIVSSKDLKLPEISEEEKLYEQLWKIFFQTISIKERTNPRLQRQYMPKRYWQDLIEKPV